MSGKVLLATYLRQQSEIDMPDFPMNPSFDLGGFLRSIVRIRSPASRPVSAGAKRAFPASARTTTAQKVLAASPAGVADPYTRLTRIKPLTSVSGKSGLSVIPATNAALPISSLQPLTYEDKRTVFKELYTARCDKCSLSETRKKFVFGAGNVDARLMIIGEAPGADEDEQGMPFVGAAGKLLTALLQAVSIDRKKDVFITNVLKCRPPSNRTPGDAEIVACMPLLRRQIEVVAPALLLLLGRTAAQAVLDTTQSLGVLRGKNLNYRGITVVVTYHPAAILRIPEYRDSTEQDLQRVVQLLKEDLDHAAV